MPDIISRIKVEAQGADQAAREILKLRDAYRQAGEAAKGMSASIGGGSGVDPFAKATAAGGGAIAGGGNSPADVVAREERSRNYRESVKERESKNSSMGAFGPQGINQGIGVAEALSQGRGGSAVGGIASGIGSLLGGPAGIALVATAAVAMGVQKFADSSFGRLQEAFGSGNAQRLGVSAQTYDKESLGFSRMGIPIGMVKSFFSAASQSGVDMTKGSTQAGINSVMNAASLLGLSPEAGAGLIGALNRSGVNVGNVVNNGMFGIAKQSFGGANVSLFTSTLQSLVDSASSRGITLGTGSVNSSTNTLAALAQFGGFSAPGAATFAQQLQARGQQAAGVGSAEDIIAYQAMRKEGESITDTMIRMEENPGLVNKKVYEYLKGVTGGDEDQLRMRLKSYLGEGTSMSAVDKFIQTQQGMAGLTDSQVAERLGSKNTSWEKPTGEVAESINVFMVRQNDILKEFSDGMLDLTIGLNNAIQKLLGKDVRYGPLGMTKDGWRPDMTAEVSAAVSAVQGLTVQDVSNLNATIAEANLSVRDVRGLEKAIANPRYATALSTASALKADKSLYDRVESLYRLGGKYSSSTWDSFESGYGTIGGWGVASQDIAGNAFANLSDTFKKKKGLFGSGGYENEAAAKKVDAIAQTFYNQYGTRSQDTTYENFEKMMATLERLIREQGFVYTDGNWTEVPSKPVVGGSRK